MYTRFLLTLLILVVEYAGGIIGQSLGLSPDAQSRYLSSLTTEIYLNLDIIVYKVKTLPGVRFSIPQSWAGDIPIPGRGDDKLFFWLFAAESNASSGDLIS